MRSKTFVAGSDFPVFASACHHFKVNIADELGVVNTALRADLLMAAYVASNQRHYRERLAEIDLLSIRIAQRVGELISGEKAPPMEYLTGAPRATAAHGTTRRIGKHSSIREEVW